MAIFDVYLRQNPSTVTFNIDIAPTKLPYYTPKTATFDVYMKKNSVDNTFDIDLRPRTWTPRILCK